MTGSTWIKEVVHFEFSNLSWEKTSANEITKEYNENVCFYGNLIQNIKVGSKIICKDDKIFDNDNESWEMIEQLPITIRFPWPTSNTNKFQFRVNIIGEEMICYSAIGVLILNLFNLNSLLGNDVTEADVAYSFSKRTKICVDYSCRGKLIAKVNGILATATCYNSDKFGSDDDDDDHNGDNDDDDENDNIWRVANCQRRQCPLNDNEDERICLKDFLSPVGCLCPSQFDITCTKEFDEMTRKFKYQAIKMADCKPEKTLFFACGELLSTVILKNGVNLTENQSTNIGKVLKNCPKIQSVNLSGNKEMNNGLSKICDGLSLSERLSVQFTLA
ncbi:DgyrCDS14834 [Dimorphilus gyrociliatus]|uniref:DgyrCDS14834 n=1 Tax=Dimorphilus gyrociliatus TaxID=2664684 RepID=A0A7I8WF86_9ANNE|nr:DgyrCDS14834 [Dimorphilus gyrociliatus]